MKKNITLLMTILMITVMATGMSACKKPQEEAQEPAQTGKAETTETVKVVDSITDIDTEGMKDLPLEIESVTLYDDGSVKIVPLEDLKKNEIKDGDADGIYPFREFGKVRSIYLVRFGNGGYRTVICLMEDGTLSALSAKELIEDRIAVVMPNVSGRDNYVSVKQIENEDSFGVVGVTDDGEEVELDFSLNF